MRIVRFVLPRCGRRSISTRGSQPISSKPSAASRVAAALPADNPAKAAALDYVKRYESVYGAGSVSAFGSYTWDAWLELAQAIPIAAKKAKPGTREFRPALRRALEINNSGRPAYIEFICCQYPVYGQWVGRGE